MSFFKQRALKQPFVLDLDGEDDDEDLDAPESVVHQIDSSSGGEDLDEVAMMMPREVSPRNRTPEKRGGGGGAGKKAKKEVNPQRVRER